MVDALNVVLEETFLDGAIILGMVDFMADVVMSILAKLILLEIR